MTRIIPQTAACALLLLTSVVLGAQERVVLPADDERLEIRLEPLYEIGAVDGASWEEFQSLTAAAFGGDGRLYLLDLDGQRVVAAGPDGRFLHALGGRGDGPGEYRAPSALVTLPDGRVAVWDLRKRAFLLYDADGEHLDEVRPDFDAGIPGRPFALAPDGSVLAMAERLITGRLGHAFLSGSGVSRADGSVPLLRVPLIDDGPTRIVTQVRIPVPDGPPPHPTRRGFEALPSWGPLGGGRVALHHSDEYAIQIVRPDGQVERVLERPPEPRRTTEADREAYRRQQVLRPARRLGQSGGGGSPPAPTDFWFSPVIPPVLAITADGGDRIWVLRRDANDATRPGQVDVLSATGRYLGTIPRAVLDATGSDGLPAAFGPDGRVVFRGRGEFDVPVARVYRLPPALR
jgi:hypothetical protein